MPHDDELAALGATPVILESLLAEGRESRPSGDEDWTAKEVVAHLRDTEDFRLERCRRMRDRDEPYLEAFDQEVLARERDYASTDIKDALASFSAFRRKVVELLAALDD